MKDEDLELEALYNKLMQMEQPKGLRNVQRGNVFYWAEQSENFSEELKRVLSDLKPIRGDIELTEKYFDKHLRTLPNGEKYDQDPQNDIMETSWLPSFCNELHRVIIKSRNEVTFGFIYNILSWEENQRCKLYRYEIIAYDDIITQYNKDKQEEQERQVQPAPPTAPPTMETAKPVQSSETTKESSTKAKSIPDVLNEPFAQKLFNLASKANIISIKNGIYRRECSKVMFAYFVHESCWVLEIQANNNGTSWKPFEDLFDEYGLARYNKKWENTKDETKTTIDNVINKFFKSK